MSIPRLTLRPFLLLFTALAAPVVADVYELRTYTTNEGKLDDLHARFRDHTVELFAKHGMKSVGYWVPTDPERSKDTLIYVLQHKSREAAAESWKSFIADPDWKKAFAASRTDGPLLSKAPESVYLQLTDYSPEVTPGKPTEESLFELRIYRCQPGKLDNLDARFRDHTIDLFRKHGIHSVAYWHPTDGAAADDTLIYIIRHGGSEAAKASWKAFGSDPEWRKVAKESQKDGRFLRERPESVYMTPTDYSAIR